MLIDPYTLFPSGGSVSTYDDVVNSQSPWGFWKMDETSGTSIVDSITARNLGTLGSPTLNQAGLVGAGKSILLDGVDDRIRSDSYGSAVATLANGDKAFTLCIVVKTAATLSGSYFTHIGNFSNGGSQGIALGMSAAGALQIQFFAGGWQSLSSAAGIMVANTIYHVAVVRNLGGVYTLFKNGSSVATKTVASTLSCSTSSSICVGAARGAAGGGVDSTFFKGNVTRSSIHASALSGAQLLAQAQAAGLA